MINIFQFTVYFSVVLCLMFGFAAIFYGVGTKADRNETALNALGITSGAFGSLAIFTGIVMYFRRISLF